MNAFIEMLKDPALRLTIKKMQNYLKQEAQLREKFYNS